MDQPPTSSAQLIQDSQSLTIVLPPTGFKGTGGALIIFACIWTGFIAVFTAIFLGGMFFAKDILPPGAPPPGFRLETIVVPLALLPFWAIGIGLFLASIQSARRHSVFIFTRGTGGTGVSPVASLTFSQVGPFKKTEKQWPAASITRIHMDASGTVVNGKTIMQLAIHSTAPDSSEKITGLLSGRNEEELKWLASTLRDALGAPGPAPQSS